MTVGFMPDIREYAIEGLVASACVGLVMVLVTAVIGKIKKTKMNYGPVKLAMCLMLFLHIKGACIAVGIGVVLGIIFALVCKSKKRKIALAPAISISVVAAMLLKDALSFVM
jgi:leader peptidase (prepilin peptidase)/N-methyltransferase